MVDLFFLKDFFHRSMRSHLLNETFEFTGYLNSELSALSIVHRMGNVPVMNPVTVISTLQKLRGGGRIHMNRDNCENRKELINSGKHSCEL